VTRHVQLSDPGFENPRPCPAAATAIRRHQLICTAPRSQVLPFWWLTRLSPRLMQGVSRYLVRFIYGTR
jgi:hypothetical protein